MARRHPEPVEGLEVRSEVLDSVLIRRMHQHRTIQALLALALLLQKVVPAMALHGKLARSGLPDSFLSAAVGLHLRHEKGVNGAAV